MTGTVCCVPECKKNSKYNRDVSFHKFPKNSEEMLFFIKKINRRSINNKSQLWKPTIYHKICGIHYNRLKMEYNKQISSKSIDVGAEIIINSEIKNEEIIMPPSPTFKDHNYSLLENNEVCKLQEELLTLKNKLKETETKYIDQIKKTNDYKKRCIKLEGQIKENIWDINEIIKNKKQLRFYTGFRKPVDFLSFVAFIKPAYELETKKMRKAKENSGRPQKLSFEQQLILVLIKLKLGLLVEDLAYRFKIALSTVSSIWTFWMKLLSTEIIKVPVEKSLSMPECLRKLKFDETKINKHKQKQS